MKKRALSLVLALSLCMGLLVVPAAAADAKAAKTSNIGRNNYNGNWANDSHSLLYENSQGGLTRAEYYTGNATVDGKRVTTHNFTVETYDKGFQLLSAKQVKLPDGFDCWGGAFHGGKYNYLIVGVDNRTTEDKAAEVIRVIQYDQDWDELGHVGLTSGETDTVLPFAYGTNFVEAGNYLHIYTARTMGKWVTDDNTNHEANLYITVDQGNLSAKVVTNGIGGENAVHVSHSFSQHILVNDGDKIVTATHGDGDPRSFRLSVLPGSAQSMDPSSGGKVTSLDLAEFTAPEKPLDMSSVNQTDAELGGVVEAGDAYVVAYKNVSSHYSKPVKRGDYQNVYMVRIPKDNLTADGIQAIQVTDETKWIDERNHYERDGDLFSGTPVLVPTGKNTGYAMWTNLRYTTLGSGWGFNEHRVTDQLFILPYDATTAETFAASMAKKPIELKGSLSDCQPFVYNGNVVWYTTGQFKSLKETHGTMSTRAGYETTPVFYVFDGSSLTAYQDGKKVSIPDAFWTKTSTPSTPTTPTVSDDPAVKAALEKDAKLVEDFTKNSVPTDVWTKNQFQSAMDSLMKQNADPATGEQTKADVWYYEVKDGHIDIQLTLKRAGQELKIDKILTVEIPSTTKDELALVNPKDSNTTPAPQDASEVQSARDYIERLLKEELKFDSTTTADSMLNTLQNILTRRKNKTELSWGKTGFSLTPATASGDGKITGNLLFTCGTARCGLALDVPAKLEDNTALVNADKAAVQAALDAMNLNNDLTQEKVEAVIQGAIQNGSSFQIFAGDGFYLKKATKSNTGTLIVACLLTNGDVSSSFELKYTIPKLGDQKPDQPATAEAMPTNDKLTVNGVLQTPTVYKINGGNYFKLRDLAVLLNGTSCQFDVGYDAATKSATAVSGKGYTKLKTDMQGPAAGNQTAIISNDKILIDGKAANVEVYKIDGGNYFKLRDLGNALGFQVGWDDTNKVASITTK